VNAWQDDHNKDTRMNDGGVSKGDETKYLLTSSDVVMERPGAPDEDSHFQGGDGPREESFEG
jgi:hypothetical protein